MSDLGLVVQEQSLLDIEAALEHASSQIATYVGDLHGVVDDQTSGWSEDTPSRQAQRTYEAALEASIAELVDCLTQVQAAVAAYREQAHDTEVENVAVIG